MAPIESIELLKKKKVTTTTSTYYCLHISKHMDHNDDDDVGVWNHESYAMGLLYYPYIGMAHLSYPPTYSAN